MITKNNIRWASFIVVGFLASASIAHASGIKPYYFSGYRGLNLPRASDFVQKNDQIEKSGSFAGAMGFHLALHWRIEGELSVRDDKMARVSFNQDESPLGGRFKSWTGLVNVYRDFNAPGKIEPFVAMGAGYIAEETISSNREEHGTFAWQLGGGVKYIFDPSLSFSSAYRYLDSVDAGETAINADEGHELHVGVTYQLPVRPQHHPRGLNDVSR